MKHIITIFLWSTTFITLVAHSANTERLENIPQKSIANNIEQVIIWGHKLHSHTHSYVHYAFLRAFQNLGYRVSWFDNRDATKAHNYQKALFITEGQVDQLIPIRHDCFYVLHNCDAKKYQALFDKGRCLTLQVYTNAVLTKPGLAKIAPCTYASVDQQILYQPWATDLLPHEINDIKKRIPTVKKLKIAQWVGTIGDGKFGNKKELAGFMQACERDHMPFNHRGGIDLLDHIEIVLRSFMAPTIVGDWQKEVGYVPCRIFKNISYGAWGVTNSKTVAELFDNKIVYDPDTFALYYKAKERIANLSNEELFELMDIVRDQHTYINRIKTIFEVFDQVWAAHDYQ